jgi:hypothetical protein
MTEVRGQITEGRRQRNEDGGHIMLNSAGRKETVDGIKIFPSRSYENSKHQRTNLKQIRMIEIQNSKQME